MRFELHMSLDGDAFQEDHVVDPDAVALILQEVSDYLTHAWIGEVDEVKRIKDLNGNRIGYWCIAEAAEVDA